MDRKTSPRRSWSPSSTTVSPCLKRSLANSRGEFGFTEVALLVQPYHLPGGKRSSTAPEELLRAHYASATDRQRKREWVLTASRRPEIQSM